MKAPRPAPGLRDQQADRVSLPLLEQKGLAPWFELVYGGDSLPKKKPDPLPLLQVCAISAWRRKQVVAIGDSSNDAEAARAAGCFVLTVPYGYNHGRPVQTINSDGIVNSLLDAAKLISAHNTPHIKLTYLYMFFTKKHTVNQTGALEAWLWRRWQSWAN
jgi:beta-phosphoglucomutase-like phosphatase (HAD superfamily)